MGELPGLDLSAYSTTFGCQLQILQWRSLTRLRVYNHIYAIIKESIGTPFVLDGCVCMLTQDKIHVLV